MKHFLLSAALLITFAACHKQAENQQSAPRDIMTVNPSSVTISQNYSAAIEGRQDVAILPDVGGKLTQVKVKEGQHVNKGDVLFVIDQVPFRAAVETAEANVEAANAGVATAELVYRSKQILFNDSIVSDFELQTSKNNWLTAKSRLAQAKAALTIARNNLGYTEVKSPANGFVGTLPYKQGALVSPQMPKPLTVVSDNSEMFVYFSMTENQMLSLVRHYGSVDRALKEMPQVGLTLADGSQYAHMGNIETFSGVIDKSTGAVSVRAVFPNPDRLLLSGGSCNVSIPAEYTDVLIIPQAATFEIQDKVFAYRVIDGKATATQIKVTPLPDGKRYIVTQGLESGERIVAEGAGLVKDGEQVE